MDCVGNTISLPGNRDNEVWDNNTISLSVPFRNQNRFRNLGIIFGCDKGHHRSSNKARANDYEADFLQREMQRLTVREYESSEQTVLGNDPNDRKILERGDDETEEPAFISLKLGEFDAEIKIIEFQADNYVGVWNGNAGLSAYKLARDQNSAFVNDPRFKIGFLRAERYHPKQAVCRMLRYFEEKLDLFGSKKLTSSICLDDIGEHGRRYLEIGGLQILPERDKAGRLVVLAGDSINKEELDWMRRGARKGMFYLVSCIERDDTEVGKIKGFVQITWRVHVVEPPDAKGYKGLLRVWQSMPVKTAAFHICRPSTTIIEYLNDHSKMLLPALKNAKLIPFMRSHYGTAQECKYTLFKYGCPECLPIREGISSDSSHKCAFHVRYQKEWLAKRERIESKERQNPPVQLNTTTAKPSGDNVLHCRSVDKVCNIGQDDVLLGQIRTLNSHPGNVKLRQLVIDSFDEYYASTATKLQKMNIAHKIVQLIKNDGGRFMKQKTNDKGGLWVEVSPDEARKKVAGNFRNIVKKMKREASYSNDCLSIRTDGLS